MKIAIFGGFAFKWILLMYTCINIYVQNKLCAKGWLAIAKLKPLSLFISLLSIPKKAFDNVKIEK